MASLVRNGERRRPSKYGGRRPLMLLKDYLLDDLSSCSSNGFKSFPRRQQCCSSSVRFLLEHDLQRTTKHAKKRAHGRKPNTTNTICSALNRASDALINTIKLIKPPSPSSSSSSSSSSSITSQSVKACLPRSISRRLCKRKQYFWRKNIEYDNDDDNEEDDVVVVASQVKEIKQRKSFAELLEDEKDKLSNPNPTGSKPNLLFASTSSSSSAMEKSKKSSEYCSESWLTESEFAATTTTCSSSSIENDVIEGSEKNFDFSVVINDRKEKNVSPVAAGVTVGEESSVTATTFTATSSCSSVDNNKGWKNDEKQQFSPVSVLDCPFLDDEEEEITSPFLHNPIRIEEVTGNKQKLTRKMRRFECLTDQLQPLDLEKRINASLVQEVLEKESSVLVHAKENMIPNRTEIEGLVQDKTDEAVGLLNLLKERVQSTTSDALTGMNKSIDSLLLEFFRENIVEAAKRGECRELERGCFEVAKDWVRGHPRELFLGWEITENRCVYVQDMEKNGKFWRNNLREEIDEVAVELEVVIFTCLVDELLHDML